VTRRNHCCHLDFTALKCGTSISETSRICVLLKASQRRVWNSGKLVALWNNICWLSNLLCFGWLWRSTWRVYLRTLSDYCDWQLEQEAYLLQSNCVLLCIVFENLTMIVLQTCTLCLLGLWVRKFRYFSGIIPWKISGNLWYKISIRHCCSIVY